jgi:hypothetical protein
MSSTMNYDYMPAMDDAVMVGYGQESNNDLDQFFNFPQADRANYALQGGLFTPNGMNINGGMMLGQFGQTTSFQFTPNNGLSQYDAGSMGFPFPQEVDPAIIMASSQPVNSVQPSGALQDISNGQGGPSDMVFAQGSQASVERSTEPEEATLPEPKRKRTRQSKKKKLTAEQEESKRKEFLERNRQAASKCRQRKQEATAALQAQAQEYGFMNTQLKGNVHELELELAELKALLYSHPKCESPEIQRTIEYYKSKDKDQNESALNHVLESTPASPSYDSERRDSSVSMRSDDTHTPDGSINIHLTKDMPRQLSRKQRAEQEEYMKEYTKQQEEDLYMSRRGSKASITSSEAMGSATEGSARSGYTSAITTPEQSNKEIATPSADTMAMGGVRRGVPLKSFENPRYKGLVDPSLPGLDPMEYLSG